MSPLARQFPAWPPDYSSLFSHSLLGCIQSADEGTNQNLQWKLGSRTQFILENCSRRLVQKLNILCLSPERHVTDHTGTSMKGLSGRELRPEVLLTTKAFFPRTTWSRTRLFKNQDIWELRFDCIFKYYLDSHSVGFKKSYLIAIHIFNFSFISSNKYSLSSASNKSNWLSLLKSVANNCS